MRNVLEQADIKRTDNHVTVGGSPSFNFTGQSRPHAYFFSHNYPKVICRPQVAYRSSYRMLYNISVTPSIFCEDRCKLSDLITAA